MQNRISRKNARLIRLTKSMAMLGSGAMVFQTTGCAFDDVLGANLLNTVIQLVLSLVLGGGII